MSYCQARETHGTCKVSTKANFSLNGSFCCGACVCAQPLQLCPALCDPMDCRLLCPCDSPGKNTGGLSCCSPGDLPNPGIKPSAPTTPALQADSLPTEPPGKPGSPLTVFVLYGKVVEHILHGLKNVAFR